MLKGQTISRRQGIAVISRIPMVTASARTWQFSGFNTGRTTRYTIVTPEEWTDDINNRMILKNIIISIYIIIWILYRYEKNKKYALSTSFSLHLHNFQIIGIKFKVAHLLEADSNKCYEQYIYDHKSRIDISTWFQQPNLTIPTESAEWVPKIISAEK